MATARLDISLDQAIETKAEHEVMVVEGDIFDHFIKACDKANSPNSSLLAAEKFTTKSQIE